MPSLNNSTAIPVYVKSTQVADQLQNSDIVRYSQVWEDYQHSFKLIDKFQFNNILMIASGGENIFNLLAKYNVNITAIDANATQIELIKIKMDAVKKLSRAQYISFLGLSDEFKREELIALLSPSIQSHKLIPAIIEHGALFIGKLERYFHSWATHLKNEYPEFETAFYQGFSELNKIIEHSSFQQDFKEYFNEQNLGSKGRDPKMYDNVQIKSDEFFWQRFIYACEHFSNGKSSYFELFNFAKIQKSDLPYYLQNDQNYQRLKNNLSNLTLEVGLLEVHLSKDENQKYDFAILSNIFEYLSDQQAKELLTKLQHNMNSQAGLLYWNLLKPKQVNELSNSWVYQQTISEQMSGQDLSWYYQNVCFALINRGNSNE